MTNNLQREKLKNGQGFIAALDQSGGSTPKALALYGVNVSAYHNEAQMFAHIHDMRSRIICDKSFTGDQVLGAILFEDTLNRDIDGVPAVQALWDQRGVVAFLKIDNGLEDKDNDAQLLKPIPELQKRLERAKAKGVFGTKMRSVIWEANQAGIESVVAQQFAISSQVLAAGLMPIIEPEVSITATDKPRAEALLLDALTRQLDARTQGQEVMLKLTLPDEAGIYEALANHPRVLRVVALSGGYELSEAADRLSRNKGMIASFSRALTQGLNIEQTDAQFKAALGQNISTIFKASVSP